MDPKLSAKIKRIYLNSRSPYYLSGLFSFKRHLFDKYKISISLPKLKHILRQIPIFQRLSENKNAQQKNNFRSVKGQSWMIFYFIFSWIMNIYHSIGYQHRIGWRFRYSNMSYEFKKFHEILNYKVYMPGSKSKNRKGPYIGFYAFVDAFRSVQNLIIWMHRTINHDRIHFQ